MRLTLRTLLAYLDDVLPPQDTRLIGEKIAASREATAFIARIKEVIRRRRIGSPEIAGPNSGPDPNIVAEYLENLLPPDLVVELEKICQSSDIHLAEVASSHTVLTLILGQPIDAPDELREKLYSLPGVSQVLPQSNEPSSLTEGISNIEKPVSGLPDYLKPAQNQFQNIAIIGVVLLMIGWLLMVVTDRSLWDRSRPIAANDHAGQVEEANAPRPINHQDAGQPAVDNRNPAAVVPVPNSNPATAKPEEPANPQPQVKPAQESDEQDDIMAIAPVIGETHPELGVTYHSGDGFFFARHLDGAQWYVALQNFDLNVGDQIASPIPFRNGLRITDAFDLTLQGGTRLERIAQGQYANFGIKLHQGQIGIYLPAEAKNSEVIRLNILGKDWYLTLLEPSTRLGIDLIPPLPNGPPEEHADATIGGGIIVLEGRVSIQAENHPLIELTPASGYSRWPAHGDTLVTRVDMSVPFWATADGIQVSNAARQVAETFRRALPEGRDLQPMLEPLLKERRATTADLAMKSFALIGNWRELVPGLGSEHQEVRLTSIQGLKHWVAQNLSRAPDLLAALQTIYTPEQSQLLMRLIWGFSTEDAQSPIITESLIEGLKSPEISIRELSFYTISRLTSRTYDYLPMAPEVERNAAIQKWQDYVSRNQGSLLPK